MTGFSRCFYVHPLSRQVRWVQVDATSVRNVLGTNKSSQRAASETQLHTFCNQVFELQHGSNVTQPGRDTARLGQIKGEGSSVCIAFCIMYFLKVPAAISKCNQEIKILRVYQTAMFWEVQHIFTSCFDM